MQTHKRLSKYSSFPQSTAGGVLRQDWRERGSRGKRVRGQRYHSPRARQKSRKAWWGWTAQDCSLKRGGISRGPAAEEEGRTEGRPPELARDGTSTGGGGTAKDAVQERGSGRRKWRERQIQECAENQRWTEDSGTPRGKQGMTEGNGRRGL